MSDYKKVVVALSTILDLLDVKTPLDRHVAITRLVGSIEPIGETRRFWWMVGYVSGGLVMLFIVWLAGGFS